MQRAGPRPVLSGRGRDYSGLAAVLSLPMGVDGCETQTIGYTCRRSALTIFGPGFNSRRLHQTKLARPGANMMVPGDGIKHLPWRLASRRRIESSVGLFSHTFSSDQQIIGCEIVGQFYSWRPWFRPPGAQQRNRFDRQLPVHGCLGDFPGKIIHR